MLTIRNLLLGIALLVLLGAGISGVMLLQGNEKELDAKSLREQLLTIESYTSEAKLLALQNSNDKVTASYTKSQAEDVAKLVKSFSQTLQKSSAKHDLKKQKEKAVILSEQLYINLYLLEENPANKQTSKDLTKKFQQIGDNFGKLHKSIKL